MFVFYSRVKTAFGKGAGTQIASVVRFQLHDAIALTWTVCENVDFVLWEKRFNAGAAGRAEIPDQVKL